MCLNFSRKLPDKLQRIVRIFVTLLSITFFVIIFRYSIIHIQDEMLMGVTTTSMGVPMWWYTLGLPIGSGLIIFRLVQRLFTGGEDK
ncbi:MAG: TRAP transporter small permease [Halanaerobiales bacterium]|nr:TRAP transporter small permease [Halanaerobiales bacterium]